MNIRKELEALRDEYRSMSEDFLTDADRCGWVADDIDALLQRIPEGWEMRPREPSGKMIDAAVEENGQAAARGSFLTPSAAWRIMWDAAKEEGGG